MIRTRGIHLQRHRCVVNPVDQPAVTRGSERSVKRFCFFFVFLIVAVNLQMARVLADSNGTNTVVRFEIQRGTNSLGRMDVELFDQDKPETVRNFLLYTYSGAYSNTFLHRCVQGFVVQGGGFSVTNPLGTNRFSAFLEVTNFGRLTNEFLVGPRLSNTFATIAMAKVCGDTNSATSQWFFNLGNNSANLDAQNGGFTVFGRVLESTNTNEGTNILQHFNTLSTSAGIVNLRNLIGTNYQAFSDLPVSYTNTVTRVPNDRELYYVRISVLNRTNQSGQLPPTVSLLSPPPFSRFTNQLVILRGTASDDVSVARVVYRLQGGPLEIAKGTTNWEVVLSPQLGANSVAVDSIDWDGNRSTSTALATFFYVVEMPLGLQIVGAGSVVGATNGQVLRAGAYYTLTATPANGYIFDSWTGAVNSANPTLTFQVPANATNFSLTARFIPDPLPQLTGAYQGLFFAPNSPALENTGFISMSLQADGFFSGSILHRGGNYSYTGRFDSSGNAVIQGDLGGINRSINLRLQKTDPAGLITGTFAGTATEVRLERSATALPATNAPPTGQYTFMIPASSASPSSQLTPGGNGFGTGALGQAGGLNLSGVLGDGTEFSTSATLTRLSRWPLYVTLLGGRSVLLGWLSFNQNQPGNLDGSLQYIRSPDALAPTYPAGFSNQVAFMASRYSSPINGARALTWVYGLAVVNGADLLPGITNLVKLTPDNTLNVIDANGSALQLSFNPNTGLVSGSFVDLWAGTTNALSGVVLKRSDSIGGQFLQGNLAGSLTVSGAPFLVTQSVVNITLPAVSTALSEGGLVRFENDGIVTFTNSLTLSHDTSIDANGHNVLFSGGGATRLFAVQSNVNFSARGITFANGRHAGIRGADTTPPQPGGDGCGAGILNLGGAVALTNCVLTNFFVQGGDAGSSASTVDTAVGGRGLGAAICNLGGRVSLQNCVLADNIAVGGRGNSISNNGLISASSGSALGGALFSDGGDCQVQDSDFFRNQVLGGEARLLTSGEYGRGGDAAGGALAFATGTLRLVSSGFLTNTAVAAQVPATNASVGNSYGGALFVETNASAVAEQTTFANNSAMGGTSGPTRSAGTGQGGAIFNAGSLLLRECTLEQNRVIGGVSSPPGPGFGGAVASVGPLTLDACTLNNNLAQGGSYAEATTNVVAGAAAEGGAIYAMTGPVALTNSTLAFNRAVGGSGTFQPPQSLGPRGEGRGGALAVVSNSVRLIHVTMAFNEAAPGPLGDTNTGAAFGGGIANLGGTITLRGSILAGNTPGNVSGSVTDSGFNLSSDASFGFTASGSRTNIDPLLGPLAVNGGPTRTLAILDNSPALNVVPTGLPPADQRGITRPQGTAGDIGAFEFVTTLPFFVVHPLSTNVRAGTNFTFQVLASGPEPIGYFWLKDNAILPGATSTTLLLMNIQLAQAGNYAAVASNSFGSVTSFVATLTVDARPFILTQPNDLSIAPGASTSLVVVASGPALSYVWLHNDVPVPDATNASLILNNAAPGAQGSYQVVVMNFAGQTNSRVATVAFNSLALSILTQPQSVTVAELGPANFSVLVSGVPPFGYQWLFENLPLKDATNAVLTLANSIRTNAGIYRVVVTNAFLAITSAPAVLTVVGESVLSIAADSTNLLITCRGDPGRVHRLLSATDLAPGTIWTSIATNALSGAGSVVWTLPLPTNSSTYYRAVTP